MHAGRLRAALFLGLVGLGVAALVLSGVLSDLGRAAMLAQREFQNAMAMSLRALRAGTPGAVVSLLGLCLAYGFVHAVGPGHGKVVIGAYGAARRVSLSRLAGLTIVASAAQATTAVALVGAGAGLLGLGRRQLEAAIDDWLAPASAVLIGAIGAWLLVRGLRAVRHAPDGPGARFPAGRHEGHASDTACGSCGHRHGPTVQEVARVSSLREAAALVGAIALRPCTGALFLLVITWRMEVLWLGIAGAYAMALGTAAFTLLVAGAAFGIREGALLSGGGLARVAGVVPFLQIAAGLLVVLAALGYLGAGIGGLP